MVSLFTPPDREFLDSGAEQPVMRMMFTAPDGSDQQLTVTSTWAPSPDQLKAGMTAMSNAGSPFFSAMGLRITHVEHISQYGIEL